MMLHLHHAVVDGHKKAFLRTVNSDIIVLAVHFFKTFQNPGLTELWIGFGSSKAYTDIPVHEVSMQLGTDNVKHFHSSMLLQVVMLHLACWALGRSQHGLLGQIFLM